MQNGHSLPHNFSLQQTTLLSEAKIAQTVFFTGIKKNYLSESDAAAFALSINGEAEVASMLYELLLDSVYWRYGKKS